MRRLIVAGALLVAGGVDGWRATTRLAFTDVAKSSGITFRHAASKTSLKFLPADLHGRHCGSRDGPSSQVRQPRRSRLGSPEGRVQVQTSKNVPDAVRAYVAKNASRNSFEKSSRCPVCGYAFTALNGSPRGRIHAGTSQRRSASIVASGISILASWCSWTAGASSRYVLDLKTASGLR